MRVNIYSCLVVFVLGCNVTAAIKHEIVEEKRSVTLRCPHSVEGEVTWSRETNGDRVDILTACVDRDKKLIPDPGRRYSSQADKSLHIHGVNVSDSGRYLCNNEAAVKLTVIPSGTIRLVAPEWTTVTLNCPHDVGGSHVPTWSTDEGEIQQNQRVYVLPSDKMLTIRYMLNWDSGLYYCDGKPAVYLTLMEAETSEREGKKTPPAIQTTSSAETTTAQTAESPPAAATEPSSLTEAAAPHLWQTVRLVIGGLYLIIMISITATTWTKARQEQKRRATRRQNDV